MQARYKGFAVDGARQGRWRKLPPSRTESATAKQKWGFWKLDWVASTEFELSSQILDIL